MFYKSFMVGMMLCMGLPVFAMQRGEEPRGVTKHTPALASDVDARFKALIEEIRVGDSVAVQATAPDVKVDFLAEGLRQARTQLSALPAGIPTARTLERLQGAFDTLSEAHKLGVMDYYARALEDWINLFSEGRKEGDR